MSAGAACPFHLTHPGGIFTGQRHMTEGTEAQILRFGAELALRSAVSVQGPTACGEVEPARVRATLRRERNAVRDGGDEQPHEDSSGNIHGVVRPQVDDGRTHHHRDRKHEGEQARRETVSLDRQQQRDDNVRGRERSRRDLARGGDRNSSWLKR